MGTVSIRTEAIRLAGARQAWCRQRIKEIEVNFIAATRPIVQLATVAVPVIDQDRALAFYNRRLGFETHRDVSVPNGTRWIEVAPRGVGTTVALIAADDEHPAGVETGIRLVTHDADALHADLTEHGIDAGPVLRWPGVPAMFLFRDPDGNRLVIIEDPSV
jgi:lactoylglutathione lyase